MKIYIWGMGFAAKELLEKELKNIKIEAFIDNQKRECTLPVISPESAREKEYDAIIVATGYAREIYQQATEMGFDMSKFIFVYNNYIFEDMNVNYTLAEKIFGALYTGTIKNRYHVIRKMMLDESPQKPLVVQNKWKEKISNGHVRNIDMYADDYNRIRTLELAANEIKNANIPGAVAELGVFQGEFAKYINAAFENRKCYLFDTFEGFRESEAAREMEDGNCGEAFVQRFKDTSLERVLEIMPLPDKIVCRKGLFPESLEGLKENFAFVSIDVDFEETIYEGLVYFYPHLNTGGYIFIHDYNSSTLKGVRRAVKRYENDNGIHMSKVPISDVCGTLIITK